MAACFTPVTTKIVIKCCVGGLHVISQILLDLSNITPALCESQMKLHQVQVYKNGSSYKSCTSHKIQIYRFMQTFLERLNTERSTRENKY